ncbi:HAD hydrolase-like protein [Candidatus Woesearchaeota archaeon]|nr:HAD hydrolase-like protein [Candidatus Woesearchaeota archaeon]
MNLAEKFDYLNTSVHFVGNLFTNLKPENVLPDYSVLSVNSLAIDFFNANGIEAIIWDVDGTLMRYHGQCVDDSIKAVFGKLTYAKRLNAKKALDAEKGLKHAILSNSGENRFRELGYIFPEIPVLRMYESNTGIIERRLYQHKDHIVMKQKSNYSSTDRSGLDSDYDLASEKQKQLRDVYMELINHKYSTIKKPDTRLIEYAMRELSISDPKKVAMVGDRAFTDITGGNQAGVCTIYISTPLHPHTDPFLIRAFARPVEALVVKMYNAIR